MSKTNLKMEDKVSLFFECGGRCCLCCIDLSYDKFSRSRVNVEEYAHIIGDKENGPRGDIKKSKLYNGDINNIILLCPTCHTKVDKNIQYYTECKLHTIKSKHIRRVKQVLDSLKYAEARIIKYSSPVGNKYIPIDEDKINDAVRESKFITDELPIDLNPNNNVLTDTNEKFWEFECTQLEQNFKNRIVPLQNRGEQKPFLLFAIATQPLLVYLGTLMNDTMDVKTFQKRREPDTWTWDKKICEQQFTIIPPIEKHKIVAVNLSLSDDISNDRITEILGNEVSIWKITHNNQHNDFIKNKNQLENLRNKYREFFRLIREFHGQKVILYVFPCCPVSAAIEFGRVWMPKADADLILYDQNKKDMDNKFIKAFIINGNKTITI